MDLLDLHLGKPAQRGALTLFPLWNGNAVTRRGYSLAAGAVQVSERAGSPVVEELVVTNPTQRPVLVLAGDLLEGGQQHRVARRSILVAAGASHVLDVLCVESGRWAGGSTHRVTRRRAPVEVRASLERGQGEVWASVDRYGARLGRNDTSSLLHTAGAADSAASAVVTGLLPLPGQCGLLVGLAGQPLLLEVSDSPRTFAALFAPLLRSVALDALGAPLVATSGGRARRFVERLEAAPRVLGGDAGIGTAVVSTSPYARLSGLTWHGRLLHGSALNVRHELVAL